MLKITRRGMEPSLLSNHL